MTSPLTVVYSFNLPKHSNTTEHHCFRTLIHSLATLRQHDPHVPIKVFMGNCQPVPLAEFNASVVSFTGPEYGWPDLQASLGHRWVNTLHVMAQGDTERVLFVDTDTVFGRSPLKLLHLYGDLNTVYLRKDIPNPLVEPFNVESPVNDGVVLLPRGVYDHMGDFHVWRTTEWERMRAEIEAKIPADKVQETLWVMAQYATSGYFLHSDRFNVEYFDPQDVSLSTEPTQHHVDGEHCPGIDSIVHHYFTGNGCRYLPRNLWPPYLIESFERQLGGRDPCRCGFLTPDTTVNKTWSFGESPLMTANVTKTSSF
jgi:hypothetical protein